MPSFISHDRKCIFIHNPRTAGTSIYNALNQVMKLDILEGNLTLQEVRALVGSQAFNDYFKFAFVRDPLERALSWYTSVQGFRRKLNFMTFVPDKVWSQHLYVDGVDFIGRYENLEADFAHACQKIGCRPQLGTTKNTKHPPVDEFYNMAKREMVTELFADDIEMFDYAQPEIVKHKKKRKRKKKKTAEQKTMDKLNDLFPQEESKPLVEVLKDDKPGIDDLFIEVENDIT